MKKPYIQLIIFIFFVGILIGGPVLGYDVTFDEGSQLAETGLGNEDPGSITFSIINTVLIFLGVVTLILIIYAGFLWMIGSRSGKENEISKAKTILRGAIIGLVIVLVSFSVANYLFSALVDITTGGE